MIQHLLEFLLQEDQLVTQDLVASNKWNWSLWSQNLFETKYQFGNFVLWFIGAIKAHNLKF
jgi:hypothetical protein